LVAGMLATNQGGDVAEAGGRVFAVLSVRLRTSW
jgi:hypothetical protein